MGLKKLFFEWKMKHNKAGRNGFDGMNKREKKLLLSNDFIDRMIKVEQRVSTSFGEYVPYKKTRYYQSLTQPEKENFDKYQKNKKGLWKATIYISFAAIAGIIIFKTGFTGNIVNNTIGSGASSWISNLFVIAMLLGFLLLVIIFILRRKVEKDFNRKFEIIDKIVSSRRFRK